MKLFPWVKLDPKTVVTIDKVYKDDIKAKFVKVCTNAHSCRDKDGNIVAYKREDYSKWSKEFYEKGENYFYTESVDPKKPFGAKRLCDPKYEWRLVEALTEEEYRRLFDET